MFFRLRRPPAVLASFVKGGLLDPLADFLFIHEVFSMGLYWRSYCLGNYPQHATSIPLSLRGPDPRQ